MDKVIKQPKQVAALLLTGEIPAVRLNAQPTESCQRFFVYATDEQVENDQMPIEWVMEAYNHQVYGNIPTDDKLPDGAFLGWIDVKNQPYADTSIWSKGQDGTLFRVICPRIFDRPLAIPCDAFEDYLFELLLDAMPVFSMADVDTPFAMGDELLLPVNGSLFNAVTRQGKITLDLTAGLAQQVLDENGNLRKFSLLTLVCGNRQRSFSFYGEVTTVLNADWGPVLFPSVLQPVARTFADSLRFIVATLAAD